MVLHMEPTVISASDTQAAVDSLMKHALNPMGPLLLCADGQDEFVQRLQQATDSKRAQNSVFSHCLVVPTSGSSGPSNLVCLTNEALRASADATNKYLGGEGRWVTVLPLAHIAGIQTVLRSTFAGHSPFIALSKHFSPTQFARTVEDARADTPSHIPLYCSLVSAQLSMMLEGGHAASLKNLDAILVGGGFVADGLLERASSLNLRVVTTYGMTETGGGCVYDGRPLEGTRVSSSVDGRLLITGPTLMAGYLDEKSPWVTLGGETWFETSDVGYVSEDGRVHLSGRSDDLVKTGGMKVNMADVARVASTMPGVRAAHVLALPDAKWGRVVVAVVETNLEPGVAGPLVVDQVRSELGGASAPRYVATTRELPKTSLGKVDRRAAEQVAERAISQGGAWHR